MEKHRPVEDEVRRKDLIRQLRNGLEQRLARLQQRDRLTSGAHHKGDRARTPVDTGPDAGRRAGLESGLRALARRQAETRVTVRPEALFDNVTETSQHEITRFRETMSELHSRQRGAWGEKACRQAIPRDHHVISGHFLKPTNSGFDLVSWDEPTKTIHIWEAKNYSFNEKLEQPGRVANNGAWSEQRLEANKVEVGAKIEKIRDELHAQAVEKYRLQAPVDRDARLARLTERYDRMLDALRDPRRVKWHFCYGPDSSITPRLESSLTAWNDSVTWSKFSYEHMNRVYQAPNFQRQIQGIK